MMHYISSNVLKIVQKARKKSGINLPPCKIYYVQNLSCILYGVLIMYNMGGARGVMIIVVGNEHGDTSSNPGRDWLHFTLH